MLDKVKTLNSYKLANQDEGKIGTVKDFYFDDNHWTIRYLVADTGSWLTGRQVLLSPYALVAVMPEERQITINLTKQQIESSPALSSDKPVSQQFEMDYYGHYGYPIYWGGFYAWGAYPYLARNYKPAPEQTAEEKGWDPHLRSAHEVSGYHIQAADGAIGHIEDFVIDDETWAIRYLIIDTRNWLPGKKILIAPQWIDRVSWGEAKVFINFDCEAIKHSPIYTEAALSDRDYESRLHQHYGRPGYWESTAKELAR